MAGIIGAVFNALSPYGTAPQVNYECDECCKNPNCYADSGEHCYCDHDDNCDACCTSDFCYENGWNGHCVCDHDDDCDSCCTSDFCYDNGWNGHCVCTHEDD